LHMKAKEMIENAKIEVFMVLFWNRTIDFWNVFFVVVLILKEYVSIYRNMISFVCFGSICNINLFFSINEVEKRRRKSSLCKSYKFALLIYFRC
jgi:hypothetical protein